MTIYYLSTHETFNRDYKVEANSKEEAMKIVKDGGVDHFDEDWVKTTIDRGSVKTEEEEKLTNLQEQLMSTITNVLGDYCKANNLEYLSADDILHTYPNLTDDQKLWLKTFIKAWDMAQEAELWLRRWSHD